MFRTIHQNNKGISGARNRGLKYAEGNYICFIDSDDYIHPKFIEILYDAITSGDFDFSMIYYKQIWNGRDITNIGDSHNIIYLSQDFLMKKLCGTSSTQYQVVWHKMYRREILDGLFFNNSSSEDTEYNNNVFLKTTKAILVKEHLYYWLQRGLSITHQKFNKKNVEIPVSYYHCLQTIPTSMEKYQAYCLSKLYKTLLSLRYLSKNTEYKEYASETIRVIESKTYRNFIKNHNIPIFLKIILLTFLFIPISYSFFVGICNIRAKLFD